VQTCEPMRAVEVPERSGGLPLQEAYDCFEDVR
jgi:hypothetical protein